MSSVLIQSLLLASAGLFSVGSITLVVLLLISDRGWHNGLSYALGYTSAYTVIGVSVVLLRFPTSENNSEEPSILFPIMLIGFGTLLLWFALRNWQKPVQENSEESRFFSIIDTITPAKAFGFGAIITVINLKNLALFLTALSVVVQTDLPIIDKILITLLVVLVFCLSVIVPVGIYILFPARRNDLLNRIRQSLNRHSRTISIWVPIFFGLIFVIKGATDLL